MGDDSARAASKGWDGVRGSPGLGSAACAAQGAGGVPAKGSALISALRWGWEG